MVVDIAAAAQEQRSVHKGGAPDVPRMAAALADAFADDPAMSWVVPDDRVRRDMTERAFALMSSACGSSRTSATRPRGVGAAVWELPGRWKSAPARSAALGRDSSRPSGATCRGRWALYASWSPATRATRTTTCRLSASVPEWQGRGMGAALLKPMLDRCDAERMPAYLEASSPRNRALYERHGFAVTEEFHLGKGSPPLWRMWREPQLTGGG